MHAGAPLRFRDEKTWIESFQPAILIECPHCSKCVTLSCKQVSGTFEYTYACLGCGSSDKHVDPSSLFSSHFSNEKRHRLNLWLQTSCCGDILWALNEEHLTFLEGYVSAKLRERRPSEFGWSNHSLFGRLPRWVTSAKNRDEVLRGIRRLKQRLPELR
jgi:hypothetical protein